MTTQFLGKPTLWCRSMELVRTMNRNEKFDSLTVWNEMVLRYSWHFGGHFSVTKNFYLNFHSNNTSIFTSVLTPTLMMLSFYSTLQTTAEHLFTFQFPLTFHNNNTCNYSICKRRFEKGIFCWNILSSCICTIVDVFLSYIVTLYQQAGNSMT